MTYMYFCAFKGRSVFVAGGWVVMFGNKTRHAAIFSKPVLAGTFLFVSQRWFTKLPPVLTFELSRFEFNQSLGQPEKIHTKLEFPQIIYMDR